MTNLEFSNEFDVLYNNITSNQAPGLDDYEKSVFLTKAQDELVKAYFEPILNKSQNGYDGNERRQMDFSMLTMTSIYEGALLKPATFDNHENSRLVNVEQLSEMVINEFVDVDRNGTRVRLNVIPITYTDYAKMMSKPYKRPSNHQAWRVFNNTTPSVKSVELIVGPMDTIIKYVFRYVKKPRAIILSSLEGLSIDGDSEQQTCELDPILHREILQRAVELAKASYMGGLQEQLVLGTASQTNIGINTR